jgi:hypothetical protein
MGLDFYIFFELQDFLIVPRHSVTAGVRELNACLDDLPPIKPGQWYAPIHIQNYSINDGVNYQQI